MKEKKKKRSVSPVRIIILIIAIACFAYGAFHLIQYGLRTLHNKSVYSDLADQIESAEVDSSMTPEEQHEAMMKKYGKLYEQNHDFIGWLKVDDTIINYPVMFTPDDPQKYLYKSFDQVQDWSGCLFVDGRSTISMEDVSYDLIIYGHRMKNNTMFAHLEYFQDPEFVADHKYILFDTLYKPGTYEIFACYLSQIYDDNDTEHFKYYDFIDCDTQEQLDEYLNFVRENADYLDEDSLPDLDDEIITLSTCNYHVTNGRLVVAARRINEDPGFNQADYGEITVDDGSEETETETESHLTVEENNN